MKNFTSLLLAIIMAVSLCGCRFENESVTAETTYATTASENCNAPFPINSVFLDEIYLELTSPKDGSYLELRNSLPQSIIDTINKYGNCYLYDSRIMDYAYETNRAIRFFPYELNVYDPNVKGKNVRQIYGADILPPSRYEDDGEYETLYEVVLIFDKTSGIFSLQGYDYGRTLVDYSISKFGIRTLSKSDREIIRKSVDITDDINQHILYVSTGISDISLYGTSFFEGTIIYDSSLKEIDTYHLGEMLDAKPINIDFSEHTYLFNYPFLDNNSKLMLWYKDSSHFPYTRACEEISENVKQKIDTFTIFTTEGGSPWYNLYEKEDGTYFIVKLPYDYYLDTSYEVYPFEGELSLSFTLDECGRCYLCKEFFMEDLHLTAPEKYICYIPKENCSIELLNSDFSYSELDEKIEEILKYSES